MAYKPGEWWAHCDVCGFKHHASDIKKRWDGLMVCPDDFESDHPQKFLRVQNETMNVPWVREETTDLTSGVCYLPGLSGYAGLSTAGCAKAGNTAFAYSFLFGMGS